MKAIDNKKNSFSLIKFFIFFLLLAFLGSLSLHTINISQADDLPRHIMNGQMILQGHFEVLHENAYSYTETHFPFVNHHWLFGVIVYLLYVSVGWGGLVVSKVVLLLITFSILFYTALKKSHFWLVSLLSIPTIFILSGRTDLRPELFSYFFIAVFLYILTCFDEYSESKKLYFLIPLQILWVNTHVFFAVGILLVGGFLVEKIILYRHKLRENKVIRTLVVVLIGLIAACFINPNGIKGALELYTLVTANGIVVTENQSVIQLFSLRPFWDDLSIVTFVFMIPLFVLSFLFSLKKKNIFYFLACVGTAVVGFLMIRNIVFFSLIFLPAVSSNLCDFGYKFIYKVRNSVVIKSICITLFITVTIVCIMLGYTNKISIYKKFGVGLTPRSLEGAQFLIENKIKGPILNDFDSGSYLIFHMFPSEKVFVDNRQEAYPESFFNHTYFPSFEDEVKFKELSETYHFNVIFLYQYDFGEYIRPFIFSRIVDPDWVLVYVGTNHFIFVKNTLENKTVIDRFRITSDNVKERIDYLVQSPNFDDQVAAADIFNFLGREDLGMETFSNVVKQWPEKRYVWMIMGEWELLGKKRQGDPFIAITNLKKAIDLGEKTAEAYYYLGTAYRITGQLENAKTSFQHAVDINPEYKDSADLLLQIKKEID